MQVKRLTIVMLDYGQRDEYGRRAHTSRISRSVIEPGKSCLLANTSKDAPANRYMEVVIDLIKSVRNVANFIHLL